MGGHPIGEQEEKSYFLVVEGLDGSGKSTQSELIAEELRAQKKDIVTTSEPTGYSSVAQKIADVLQKKIKMESLELQKLFAKDRKEHTEHTIIPSLEGGKIIISDRYAFSSFAYGSLQCDVEELIEMNKHYPMPDLAFFIDVDLDECLKRIGKRGKPQELFEEKQKMQKIRDTYAGLTSRFSRFKIIDGNGAIQETHAKCMNEVNRLIA